MPLNVGAVMFIIWGGEGPVGGPAAGDIMAGGGGAGPTTVATVACGVNNGVTAGDVDINAGVEEFVLSVRISLILPLSFVTCRKLSNCACEKLPELAAVTALPVMGGLATGAVDRGDVDVGVITAEKLVTGTDGPIIALPIGVGGGAKIAVGGLENSGIDVDECML